jgi:hypothetical protein
MGYITRMAKQEYSEGPKAGNAFKDALARVLTMPKEKIDAVKKKSRNLKNKKA